MNKKWLNRVILGFIFAMGLYHIIPSEYLFGRLVYYFALYGLITYTLLYFGYGEPLVKTKKDKKFYLISSFYGILKLIYHSYIAIFKYEFMLLYLDSELLAGIFSFIVVFILILFNLNNKYE